MDIAPQNVEKSLGEQLDAWLKEHRAVIVSKIATPRGEFIDPANFVPLGWQIAFDVISAEKPI